MCVFLLYIYLFIREVGRKVVGGAMAMSFFLYPVMPGVYCQLSGGIMNKHDPLIP